MLPQSVRSAASVLLVVLLGLLGAGAARADVRGDVQVGVRASVQADVKADLQADVQADVQTSPTGECPRTITAPQVAKDRQPLVLVHGWTGTASGWDTTIQGLKQRLPDNFDYLTFDYSSANTDWAAEPTVADCLARYVNAVGEQHQRAGGDGKVYIVAHSMGGLAALFASDTAYTRSPIAEEHFGGLVTVGTPYQGSPFGNTLPAEIKETWDELWSPNKTLPPRMSNAAKCLARHDEKHWMPSGCPKPPAAPGRPITMISTTTTISRTLFGIKLYDIDLRTDGVVPVTSATGYLSSEYDRKGIKASLGVKDVSCRTTSDQTMAMLRSALSGAKWGGVVGAVISMEVAALGKLVSDSAVLDQILSGEPGLQLAIMSLVSAWIDSCGHSNSTKNPQVLDRIADSVLAQWNRARTTPAEATTGTRPVGTGSSTPGGGALAVVFDLSGSMNDHDAAGTVKLEGAKSALEKFVLRQPSSSEIGLWTYPGGDTVDGCAAGDFAGGGAVGRVGDGSRLTALIDGLGADGNTPTGPALRAVVDRLMAQGYRGATILLVSDGESNCGPPPCSVAADVSKQGFDVTINAMGFQLSPAGREELQCVANTTGGAYVPIDDTAQLDANINRLGVPNLEVKAQAPSQAIVGQQVTITGSVTNPSSRMIQDAQIGLTFTDQGSQSMFPAVLPPRFRLGNIAPGETISRSWTVAAGVDLTGGTANYRVTTWGNDVSAVDAKGTITVNALDNLKNAAGSWLKTVTESGRVVVMGDSYSAGEGAGDYVKGTDVASNRCHQSTKTHTLPQFPEDRRTLIACSGAVIEDMWSGQNAPNSTVEENQPQIAQLRHLAKKPDAVVLTLGGNDVGFASIVEACVKPGECGTPEFRERAFEQISQLNDPSQPGQLGRLSRVYQSIYSIINDDESLKQRQKAAPVLVLAYPAVLPRDVRGNCSGFSQTEITLANQIVERLNAAISAAVTQAAKGGRHIYFVDQTANAVQPNHTSCDPEPYIRGVTVVSGASTSAFDTWLATQAAELHTSDYPSLTQQFMHPNAKGYNAITVALYGWSSSINPDLTTPGPTTLDQAEPSGINVLAIGGAPVIQVGSESTVTPGQQVVVGATQLQPSVPVQITLNSSRRVLANARTDDKGTLSQSVTIPPDVEIGRHTIKIEYLDGAGIRSIDLPVAVRAGMPWWLLPLAGLALATALAALTIFVRIRLASRKQA